jgi:hypothetical protein
LRTFKNSQNYHSRDSAGAEYSQILKTLFTEKAGIFTNLAVMPRYVKNGIKTTKPGYQTTGNTVVI